jgi:hypothetical protein
MTLLSRSRFLLLNHRQHRASLNNHRCSIAHSAVSMAWIDSSASVGTSLAEVVGLGAGLVSLCVDDRANVPVIFSFSCRRNAATNRMPSYSSFDVWLLQLVLNPNSPWMDRPVVVWTTIVLTNTDFDLTVTSDHRIRHASLGLEDGSGFLVSDLAMARYLANRGTTSTVLRTISEPALLACTIYMGRLCAILDAIESRPTTLQRNCHYVGTFLAIADLLGRAVVTFGGCRPIWWSPRISVAFESKKRYGIIISSHLACEFLLFDP